MVTKGFITLKLKHGKRKLTEHERIYLKVEVNSDVRTLLMHANDAEWTDVNVTLPLIL